MSYPVHGETIQTKLSWKQYYPRFRRQQKTRWMERSFGWFLDQRNYPKAERQKFCWKKASSKVFKPNHNCS